MKFPYFEIPWFGYDVNLSLAILAMLVFAVVFIAFLLKAIIIVTCEENRKEIRKHYYLAFLSVVCFITSVYIGSWIFLLLLLVFIAVIIYYVWVIFRELLVSSYYYARYAFLGKEIPEDFLVSQEE